jgi:hypothetical protein
LCNGMRLARTFRKSGIIVAGLPIFMLSPLILWMVDWLRPTGNVITGGGFVGVGVQQEFFRRRTGSIVLCELTKRENRSSAPGGQVSFCRQCTRLRWNTDSNWQRRCVMAVCG